MEIRKRSQRKIRKRRKLISATNLNSNSIKEDDQESMEDQSPSLELETILDLKSHGQSLSVSSSSNDSHLSSEEDLDNDQEYLNSENKEAEIRTRRIRRGRLRSSNARRFR